MRPKSRLQNETVNVAVWNIREFGRVRRTDAALHYIAEIIGQFDFVAIVELRNNLEDLGCVMDYLGDSWKVVFSDWTDDRCGNDERTAFLYDRRAVIHNGLAAEIDAPRIKRGNEWVTEESFWRAPYLCSFRAGNFDFLVRRAGCGRGLLKSYESTQPFAKALADLAVRQLPDRVVSEMSKDLRRGKVLIDWSQNSDFKTTVCVYAMRAKPGGPFISMPISWDELAKAVERRDTANLFFTPAAAVKRIGRLGDLFEPVLKGASSFRNIRQVISTTIGDLRWRA